MGREYLNYVNEALNKGMSSDEVRFLFNDIYAKSNTKQGKKVLRLFARGIGKAKKNVLMNQNTMFQNEQPSINEPIKTEGGYQYQYFKQ